MQQSKGLRDIFPQAFQKRAYKGKIMPTRFRSSAKSAIFVSTALAACFAATTASAQSFYAGISGGTTKSNVKAEDSTSAVRDAVGPSGDRFVNINSTEDAKDSAYRVFGGYRVAPFFAVEAHYSDLGKYSLSTSAVVASTNQPGTLNSNFKSKGFGVDALFIAPIAEGFSIFGKLGVFRSKTEATFSSSGAIAVAPVPVGGTPTFSISPSADRTSAVYGVGLQYDFNKQISARADLTRYDKLGNDSTGGKLRVDALMAGVLFNF
jgi:OmpA-OmpF porin, OOP family